MALFECYFFSAYQSVSYGDFNFSRKMGDCGRWVNTPFCHVKKKQYFCTPNSKMFNRTIHMIFEPSGMPAPSNEEVRNEAREMVARNGWGVPIILAVKKIANPYWREAIARCLLEKWQQMVANKDEQVFNRQRAIASRQ